MSAGGRTGRATTHTRRSATTLSVLALSMLSAALTARPSSSLPTTTAPTTTAPVASRIPVTTSVRLTPPGLVATVAAATAAGPTTLPATTTSITASEPERPKPPYVDRPNGPRERAAAYAYIWADKTNPDAALFLRGKITVPSDNPTAMGRAVDTEGLEELDCTNYMSQALRASGFEYVPAWRYNPVQRTATTAWVRAAGPKGLAATFVKLRRMRLMSPVGTVRGEPPPPGIQIGDIVVWDLNDDRSSMFIDHQLMVTEVSSGGTTWGDIRVSYHTYDHRNRAMDEYQDFVSVDAPKARLYVFHVNYPA